MPRRYRTRDEERSEPREPSARVCWLLPTSGSRLAWFPKRTIDFRKRSPQKPENSGFGLTSQYAIYESINEQSIYRIPARTPPIALCVTVQSLLLEQRGEHLLLGGPEVLVVRRGGNVHRLCEVLARNRARPVEKAPEVGLLEGQLLAGGQPVLDLGDQFLFGLFGPLALVAGQQVRRGVALGELLDDRPRVGAGREFERDPDLPCFGDDGGRLGAALGQLRDDGRVADRELDDALDRKSVV